MAVLLALAASALYGTADFFGGLASRRATTFAVATISQLVGLTTLLLALPFLPASTPARSDFLWGAATGVAGAFSLLFFYRALATGRMSVVAPIAAATGNVVSVLIGLLLGERPGPLATTGLVLAVVAVVLIGQEGGPLGATPSGRGIVDPSVLLALAAGVAIGAFLACLHRTSAAAGIWPLVAARAVSGGLLLALALLTRRPLRMPADTLRIVAAAGVIDMMANVCYLVAVHGGLLSIVATLASLYPATTILLARGVLRERVRSVQLVGLTTAALAIALITAG
jgi:uncharacterized membrane protein